LSAWKSGEEAKNMNPSPKMGTSIRRFRMQITKETIKNIGKIFEKGLQDEYLSRAIGKIMEHEKEKTSQDIQSLKRDLEQFEGRYNMASEEFFSRFERGELGDKEDYFEWSAIYQMYKRSMERLEMLEGES
jgi:hypothetical protein